MVCARWRLSMPLPMVALPCGSRSTSSTRCLVAARLAARLTLVVVLPTPPFWLVIARIFAIALTHRTEQNQMTLGAHSRHLERDHASQLEPIRQLSQFFMRVDSFHRGNGSAGGAQTPGELQELGQVGNRARNYQLELALRLPRFDALTHHLGVGDSEFDRGLAQERRFLMIAVEQRHAGLPPDQCKRDPGQARAAADVKYRPCIEMWH